MRAAALPKISRHAGDSLIGLGIQKPSAFLKILGIRGDSFHALLTPNVMTMQVPSPTRQMPPQFLPPPTVMVVEDDDDNRLMLRTLLEMKGYHVVEARDGQEATEVLEQERPQLILVDLQLPRVNGFALARRVRQHERLSDVPIVVVSGHDPAQHGKLALAAGCNDYLLKPINFDRLEEILCRLAPLDGHAATSALSVPTP